jgi:hypothetical protein
VRYIRDYFAGKVQPNIHGRVVAAKDIAATGMLDYLLSTGEAKPLRGATVSTVRNGKTYSTVTDANGKYTLPVPGRGSYELNAGLRPYFPTDSTAEIEGGGCAVSDFSLASGSTISGFVRDSEGRVVTNSAQVGLIGLDPPSADHSVQPLLLWARTEQPDHSFLFRDVPIGRYLLEFSPDGPRSGRLGDQIFESTFFPRGASRPNAKTIEVTRAEAHLTGMDVVIGKPVTLRSVVVRVRFADGAPMNWAEVRVTGESIEAGGEPWAWSGSTHDKGVARFEAPANVNLRIEVQDAYGRDLKEKYVSTHAAAMGVIEQEFVIRP